MEKRKKNEKEKKKSRRGNKGKMENKEETNFHQEVRQNHRDKEKEEI